MPTKPTPLLCELHAHTTWSDGVLTPRELVDLYGRRGFDVLAITDHCSRRGGRGVRAVDAARYSPYLAAIEREAERARALYDLLVLPGLELSYDDPDPRLAAHAVAIGLRAHVELDVGLEAALEQARGAGAALVAAHPYPLAAARASHRGTGRFGEDWRELSPLVDRWELFNQNQLFAWVAEVGLAGIATGDFHRLEHLATWKTLVPCAKDERALVDYLRSPRPTYLVRLDEDGERARAA